MIIFSLTILIVILLILVEMPVGFAFGFGALFYGFTSGIDVSYHATYGMAQVGSFSLLALPLFVMAGTLMGICGISERLLNFIDAFVGRTKGGLGVVTVIACALFGAISGSAAAAIAAIGKIMAPRMIKNGYDPGYVTGLIAVSSVLAFLIPPSIPMIVFAIATRQSVAECFLSTMFPGILLTMLYCFLNIFFLRHDMNIKVAPKKGNKEIWREIVFTGKRAVWAIVMPVLILGGIYSGICSPTEAGAVGVVYTLIVGKFVFKALSVKDVFDATLDAATIVGSVIVILCFLFVMSRGMVLASIPGQFADLLLGLSDNRIVCFLQAGIPHLCKTFSPVQGGEFSCLNSHERIPYPVARTIEDKQVTVMHQSVDHCRGHLFVVKDPYPSAELKVGCQYHAPFLVTFSNNLEEQLGCLPVQGYVAPFITNQKVHLPDGREQPAQIP